MINSNFEYIDNLLTSFSKKNEITEEDVNNVKLFIEDKSRFFSLSEAERVDLRLRLEKLPSEVKINKKSLDKINAIAATLKTCSLPSEIWDEILSYISIPKLGNMARVSKEFESLTISQMTKKINTNNSSLSKLGMTKNQALAFAVKNELKSVNLAGFPDLSYEELDNLIRNLPELTRLFISSNTISFLPTLPQGLQLLLCDHCPSLNALPALPQGLQLLFCNRCPSLNALPTLPPGLQRLDCSGCLISALPALPAGLQQLECSNCPISALPAIPPGLQRLDCRECPISAIPALPPGLQWLDCHWCPSLNALPALPPGLQRLYCSQCPISALPALPSGLQRLNCFGCPISALPALPQGLQQLICGRCPINALPALPQGLQMLDCRECPINAFPDNLPNGLIVHR